MKRVKCISNFNKKSGIVNSTKKIGCLLLACILAISVITVPAFAATGEEKVTQKLQQLQAADNYKVGTVYKGTGQCMGFAKSVFSSIFGTAPTWNYNGTAGSGVYQVAQLKRGQYSQNNIRNLINQAKPGDIIQAEYGYYKDNPHTMIFCWKNSNDTFTVYDANGTFTYNLIETRQVKYTQWNGNKAAHFTLLRANNYLADDEQVQPQPQLQPSSDQPGGEKADISNGTYTVGCSLGVNLNVWGGKDYDGARVCGWKADGSREQKWWIESCGDGSYKFFAICSNGGYGRVLDVNRGSSYSSPLCNGLPVDLWQENDPSAEKFNVIDNGNGTYHFELAAVSGSAVTCASGSNNAGLSLEAYSGADGQQWTLNKI